MAFFLKQYACSVFLIEQVNERIQQKEENTQFLPGTDVSWKNIRQHERAVYQYDLFAQKSKNVIYMMNKVSVISVQCFYAAEMALRILSGPELLQ